MFSGRGRLALLEPPQIDSASLKNTTKRRVDRRLFHSKAATATAIAMARCVRGATHIEMKPYVPKSRPAGSQRVDALLSHAYLAAVAPVTVSRFPVRHFAGVLRAVL